MNIQQLKGFICVSQTCSITKAARQMHLTQQALSKNISCLEEELDVLLFERSDKGTTLTNIGRKLLPIAQSLVRKYEEHEMLMHDVISQNSHNIQIAFENSVLISIFPPDLLTTIGDIRISAFIASDNASCVKSVLDGSASCAFCVMPPDLQGLQYYEVIQQYPYVIMNKNHPLARKEFLTIEDLKHEPHAWLSINSQSFQDYYKACINTGFYPKITKEYPSVELLYQDLPNGMEIAVGMNFLFEKYQHNLECRPLICDECILHIGFIYPNELNSNANLQSYFQVVRDAYTAR